MVCSAFDICLIHYNVSFKKVKNICVSFIAVSLGLRQTTGKQWMVHKRIWEEMKKKGNCRGGYGVPPGAFFGHCRSPCPALRESVVKCFQKLRQIGKICLHDGCWLRATHVDRSMLSNIGLAPLHQRTGLKGNYTTNYLEIIRSVNVGLAFCLNFSFCLILLSPHSSNSVNHTTTISWIQISML